MISLGKWFAQRRRSIKLGRSAPTNPCQRRWAPPTDVSTRFGQCCCVVSTHFGERNRSKAPSLRPQHHFSMLQRALCRLGGYESIKNRSLSADEPLSAEVCTPNGCVAEVGAVLLCCFNACLTVTWDFRGRWMFGSPIAYRGRR